MPKPKPLSDQDFERILQFVGLSTVTAAEIEALTLEDTIRTLLTSGMTKEEVRSYLLTDLNGNGKVFSALTNGFKAHADGAVKDVYHMAQREVYTQNLGDTDLFTWELDPSVMNHCDDCEERAGREPMSWAEWEMIGLPGAGATVCGDRCYCTVAPVDANADQNQEAAVAAEAQ